jgi:hypothetical protein
MPHGFNWFKIVCLVLVILFAWGVHYGMVITPQVRSTANKVVQLNNLEDVNMKVGWGGCSIPIKGNL